MINIDIRLQEVQSTLRLDINKRSYRNNSCSFLGSKETSKDCPVLSAHKLSIWYLSLTFKLNLNISGKYPISSFFERKENPKWQNGLKESLVIMSIRHTSLFAMAEDFMHGKKAKKHFAFSSMTTDV